MQQVFALNSYLAEHSYLGNHQQVTLVDYREAETLKAICQLEAIEIDKELFPHVYRWYVHVSHLSRNWSEFDRWGNPVLAGSLPRLGQVSAPSSDGRPANLTMRALAFDDAAYTEHDITPYCMKYGGHPRFFNFDRRGRKMPLQDLEWTLKGINSIKKHKPDLYEKLKCPAMGEQVLADHLQMIADELRQSQVQLTQSMLERGELSNCSVQVDAYLWSEKGTVKLEERQPELYSDLGQPVAGERVTNSQEKTLADFLRTSREDAVGKLLGAGDFEMKPVKLELAWTTAGVDRAETKNPDFYEQLGRPKSHDRVSAVQLSLVQDLLKKPSQEVIKMMLRSEDVCETSSDALVSKTSSDALPSTVLCLG